MNRHEESTIAGKALHRRANWTPFEGVQLRRASFVPWSTAVDIQFNKNAILAVGRSLSARDNIDATADVPQWRAPSHQMALVIFWSM
jgi:hypothetical protein